MVFCDSTDYIIRWGSENVVVKYLLETDNKIHRYFLDFYVEIQCKSGNTRKMILEYKPFCQTLPPKKPTSNHWKRKNRYIKESLTYIKNQNKWKAAKAWADSKNMEFYVITEKDTKKMLWFKEYYNAN